MASDAKTIRRVLSGQWAKPESREQALAALRGLEEQLETARNILREERRWREETQEQYQAALDLLARVQPELAPNYDIADELRETLGLKTTNGSTLIEDIRAVLNPASEPPDGGDLVREIRDERGEQILEASYQESKP